MAKETVWWEEALEEAFIIGLVSMASAAIFLMLKRLIELSPEFRTLSLLIFAALALGAIVRRVYHGNKRP